MHVARSAETPAETRMLARVRSCRRLFVLTLWATVTPATRQSRRRRTAPIASAPGAIRWFALDGLLDFTTVFARLGENI